MAISLIMLLLLTLIGVTGSQVTGLEEKMAGNMKDRNIAFQAAESALRDGLQDVLGRGTTPRASPISGTTGFWVTCNFDNVADTDDDGLCDRKWNPTSAANIEPTYSNTSISWPAFATMGVNYPAFTLNMTTTPSVPYGRFTGATPIAGVSAQPRYIIEGQNAANLTGNTALANYRITVRAQGSSANTVVWLQAVYAIRQ